MSEIEPLAKGIVLALQPGTFGGQAVAEVLLGITNPSGKLAFTYPKAAHDLLTYDAQYSDVLPEANAFGPNGEGLQYRPQYPFGYGLSYTTFEYSNLTVSKKQLVGTSDSVVVQVTVQNTGKVAGKEAIDLFVRDVFASINPAYKKHKAFTKINLAPGEKKTVSFTIKVSQLAMVNQASQTVTEEGEFLVMVGNLQQSINYKK
jgi:beta-glucosidase